MSSLVIPNAFLAGTVADPAKVNQNYQAIAAWANTEAIHKDASVAFTAIPSLPGTNPSTANQATRKQYVDDLVQNAVPAGTVSHTVAAGPPTGWLFVDGSTITNGQSIYPSLWAVIPAAWKSGANIVLPDWRGRMIIAVQAGNARWDTVGEIGGTETVALAAGNLPPHTHSGATGGQSANHTHGPGAGAQFSNFTAFGGGEGFVAGGNAFPASSATAGASNDHVHGFTTDGGAGLAGTAFNIHPFFVALNQMIKAH